MRLHFHTARALGALLPITLFLAVTTGAAAAPDFTRDIKPLLAEYCYDCHDTATQKSGLDL
jgi:hypothetical protein